MNTYLIASDSYKMIDNEVSKIIGSSLNVITYNLASSTLDEVLSEASYLSLMEEQKFIIVKSSSLFKSAKKEEKENSKNDDNQKIINYLKSQNPNVTLIFTSYEMPDKRKKLYKEIEKEGKVILYPALNKKDLTYKCIELLKNNGYKASYETACYIVENSYINYDIMTNEIDKIKAIVKKGTITIDDIEDAVSISINGTAFDYINAIMNKNLKSAFNFTNKFETLKIEPSVVITMLAKEFLILNLLKSGIEAYRVQSIYRKEDWQMRSYLENAQKFSKSEIKNNIIKLNTYDFKIKSGQLDRSVILDLIAFDLCY